MSRKIGKSSRDKQLEAALKEEFGIKNEDQTEKIDVGDSAALKRSLCDAVVEILEGAGYTIDYKLIDTKIALGLISCILACVAQFWPSKDPWSKTVLVTCVSAYFCLSLVMTLLSIFVEKDIIATTKQTESKPAIVAHAKLPRFSEKFTLIFAPKGVKIDDKKAAGHNNQVVLEKSVGAYFTSDGVLAKESLRGDVEKLLQQYEDKKSQ